jgi:hypothetical protein
MFVTEAIVPMFMRFSPPPTSGPREIRTTPNSGVSAPKRSPSSFRYRSSKIRKGKGMPGIKTVERGNIGITATF